MCGVEYKNTFLKMGELQPKLRFPEFEGDWEKDAFENLVKINQGLQIPISERFLEEVENSHFYITNEFLREGSQKKYFIKNPTQSVLCTEDDILMTRTGNTGMVVTNVKGAFHNNFFKIRFPESINKGFLYYFLILDKTQNLIKSLAGTSTIPDLNHSDFYKIEFGHPSRQEQTKIGNFLSSIDEKINLLKEKKSLLEAYKKGIMQKIFNQEIRFKDDNGNDFEDWKKKILSEIFDYKKGSGLSKDKLVANGINKCILYGELYTKYNEVIFNVLSRTDSNEGLSSKIGDLLIPSSTTTSGIDLANVTALNFENILLGGDITVLRSTQDVNSVFYAYYLSNHKKEEIANYAQGITIVHLYYSHIKDMIIDFPSVAEQTKIANFLSAIDKKIDLMGTQIKDMQEYKKGLLQQMFV